MSVRAERWPRLRELFHEAVDLDRDDRERFLASIPGGDDSLLGELRQLLRAHEHVGGEITAGLGSAEASLIARIGEAWIGRRVGPYRIDALLGRGGMGAVYLARRVEGGFEQQVAIKVLRAELASEELVRRFDAERRILARLDHPAIARLLDGGATAEGHPYLVMEYVEGLSIERWCAEHGADVRPRLELFQRVCSAVAHAHRALVLHRDLKPDNILVTVEGEPKLLDFGIAKLLDEEGEAIGPTLTAASAPWTPAFASPEQVRGEPVTTATDVYSLGVVLYRLLAGAHPYEFEGQPLTRQAQTICDVEPRTPSDALLQGRRGDAASAAGDAVREAFDRRKRATALRGDLDAIVLKALRKEPLRRYGSVEELAEDIARHLDGRPVLAVQGRRLYHAAKLLRRHRLSATAAALVALALGAGLTATVWQARRAEVERATAQRVSDFLQDMLASGGASWRVAEARSGGGPVTVVDVLDDAAAELDRELAGRPEVELALRATLGESYATLFLAEPAARELERALQLSTELHGAVHARTARLEAAVGANLLGQGRLDDARRHLDVALVAYGRLTDAPPADVVEALQWSGYLAAAQGRLADSKRLYAEGLDVARAGLEPRHPLRAVALAGMGLGLEITGDPAGAEDFYRQARDAFRRLPEPDIPEHIVALTRLGGVLHATGTLDETESVLREALVMIERRAGGGSQLLVEPLIQLGSVYYARGEDVEAEAVLRRAVEIKTGGAGPDHPLVAQAKTYLSRVIVRSGRTTEAGVLASEALAIFVGYPGLRQRQAEAEGTLAEIHEAAGRPHDARAMWQASRDSLAAYFGADHEYTRAADEHLAELARQGRPPMSSRSELLPQSIATSRAQQR